MKNMAIAGLLVVPTGWYQYYKLITTNDEKIVKTCIALKKNKIDKAIQLSPTLQHIIFSLKN